MKMVCDDRTLRDVANEFLALKKAQKVRERTLCDYKKYIDKFLEHSANSLDVDILKVEILRILCWYPSHKSRNVCIDLQQQMYVIWHNNSVSNRNCGIVFGNITDDLFYNHTKIG